METACKDAVKGGAITDSGLAPNNRSPRTKLWYMAKGIFRVCYNEYEKAPYEVFHMRYDAKQNPAEFLFNLGNYHDVLLVQYRSCRKMENCHQYSHYP